MQTEIMKVAGMTCGGCTSKLTNALKAVAGVAEVEVALGEGLVFVQYDESQTGRPQLQSTVERAGYSVNAAAHAATQCCDGHHHGQHEHHDHQHAKGGGGCGGNGGCGGGCSSKGAHEGHHCQRG